MITSSTQIIDKSLPELFHEHEHFNSCQMEFSSLFSLSPSNERILIEVYSIVCPISLTIEEKETEWGHRGLTEILTD